MSAADVIAIARSWLGVPFVHQGRSRLGVDCAGLIIEVMREADCLPAGFTSPRAYGRAPVQEMKTTADAFLVRHRGAALPGAIILIRWPQHPHASHVALCTGETIVHAYQRAGAVVENAYRGRWVRDTAAVYCIPGVTHE